ncbi:tetratricopeptide repeat protein [Brevibacillus sp. FIR094]|uniref:tetratricopeptide repeat protein n=1 Tax=Brevibacillus sp. FIR094 TaxID=3134809 RepID=UPI003D223A59
MEFKDIASVVALVISLVSLFISLRQKKHETERTIREKLTDTFTKITAMDVELIKLEMNINKNINLTRIFNQQRRFLVNQAQYFLPKIERLVSDSEYALLANTLERTGDLESADYYWRKSIEKSSNKLNKIYNIRGYARFLFKFKNFNQGRKMYQEAVDMSTRENDKDVYDLADTYILWGALEREHGFFDKAEEYFDLAGRMINKIESEGQKQRLKNYLNDIKQVNYPNVISSN